MTGPAASPSSDGGIDFNERYRLGSADAMHRAERRALGVDYGASGYTTVAQAEQIAAALELGPDRLLLDIGCGAGWPGLHLATSTGCDVILSDLPLEGLETAERRRCADGIVGGTVLAAGAGLALRDESCDAVTSSDVLC